MAKNKGNQNQTNTKAKPVVSGPGAGSGSLVRNFIIIVVLSIILLGVYDLNMKRAALPDLYNEFYALQDNHKNPERLNEVAHQIKSIETDTAWLKTLFVGYFEEFHFVALGLDQQLEKIKTEIQSETKNPEISREDKLNYKVHTYKLMDFVNANSPPYAVILLPPADSLKDNSKWDFIYDPPWVEYFIYPRLCIETGKENENPALAKRITHVLIVKGIGYDKLHYDVPEDKREKIILLPIDKPADKPQNTN